MQKKATIFLFLILLGAFIVRFYRFQNPIADWHSWRQADTSAVSRNFVTNGFDLLHPKFDDLSNVPSGLDNPQGYRFVEFPIYNIAQAGLFKISTILTLEEWGRLVTIFSSLLTIVFLFLLVKKREGELAALLTAFFFAFLPFNIYFDRTILPDPSMVMAITGGIYFFDRYLKKELRIMNYELWIALLFTIAAFLLKPYALIFALPMVWLVWEKFGFSCWKKWQLYIFTVLAIIPLIWWRVWIQQFPAGIPASNWLYNGNGIRFHPAFFRWIFYERITKLISGYTGVLLMAYGLWHMVKKRDWFFLSFGAASLFYLCLFATGNVQHDYYQILIIPSIAIAMGIGSASFLQSRIIKIQTIRYMLFAICCFTLFFFSGRIVREYFNINNPAIVIAGEAVDTLTPKDAKVIANYNGDTSLLYLTNRSGWPSFEKPVPEMITMGASYLLLVNPKPSDEYFIKRYALVKQTPQYLLFDLHKPL